MAYQKFVKNDGSYDSRFVIALSFAAYRRNSGYTKQTIGGDKKIWSNKELMFYTMAQMKNDPDSVQKNWVPQDFVPLEIIDQDYENADLAISFFKRYTLDALTDNFNSFKKDVLNLVSEEHVGSSKIGIVAYLPELYNRENDDIKLKRKIKQNFSESQYYTGKVAGVVEILKSYNLQKFNKYSHLGVIDGNLVSFMSDKEYPVGERYNITAKFSAKDFCEYTGVPKSRINYVKVKKT